MREPPSSSAEPAFLVIVHSPDSDAVGRVSRLGDDVLLLGRDVAPPGVSVEDPELSRLHFRLVFDGRAQGHRVGDARSRNGTFVDGLRAESAVLREGSVIRAGGSVFVYHTDEGMERVQRRAGRVAPSDLAVLLVGETGTGKERLARFVHEQSERSGAFVAVNCAALPRELIAAELFGHTRGAFSGANAARQGLFQTAAGGTLLLDEVGDLPQEVQAVLLRALQERSVRPVGADEEVPIDARIVAATHRPLPTLVQGGRFRADLYARLAQVVIHLPPLRERRSEILSLARDIASASSAELRMNVDAAEALVRYDWPFNVRELESLVRAFVATEKASTLDFDYLHEHHRAIVARFRRQDAPVDPGSVPVPEDEAVPRDRATLEDLMLRHGGNITAAAEELGKSRTQLYRWLRAAGMDPARFRQLD